MGKHKYLFLIEKDRFIKTYRYNNHDFELVKYMGEEKYDSDDIKSFFEWFMKMASIASDDYIDFCFISDSPINLDDFKFTNVDYSTWTKEKIIDFCNKHIDRQIYEFKVNENIAFVCQEKNLFNKDDIQTMYIKCFPEFNIGKKGKDKNVDNSREISLLSRYFTDKLKQL